MRSMTPSGPIRATRSSFGVCERASPKSLVALALALVVTAQHRAFGQGITTAIVTGTVRVAGGGSADAARVRIANASTGYAIESDVRSGRFYASGLETGGPYIVEVRHLGMLPQRRERIMLALGERVELDFALEPVARSLDTVRVVSPAGHPA